MAKHDDTSVGVAIKFLNSQKSDENGAVDHPGAVIAAASVVFRGIQDMDEGQCKSLIQSLEAKCNGKRSS